MIRTSRWRAWSAEGAALLVALLGGCVTPSPTATLGPSATPTLGSTPPNAESPASASPASPPTPVASARRITVVARDAWDHAMSLTIVDPDGVIATARAATQNEITPVAERADMPARSTITAAVTTGDHPGILVVWVGFGCDKSGTVTIFGGSGQIVVAPDPINSCETIASYRGLILTFTTPVDLGAVRPVLLPTKLLDA